MSDSRCPDRQQLSDYLLDKLPSEAQGRIDEHLSQCTQCQKALDTWVEGDGEAGFLNAWKQLAQSEEDQVLREAGWDRARQKLANESSSPRHDDTKPAAATTEAARIESGKILGGYRLLGLLGAGGMGEVYLAENVATGSSAALKVVQSSRRTDKALFARFQREIKALKRLQHPNIACYHESGDCDDLMYLVMEHVPGVDLEQIVKSVGRVEQADACEIVRQLAEALDHVNARGLVHRDLKPSNVMVTPAGVVKMLDLGLAKWQANPAELSRDASSGGALIGTLDYMAPEQAVASHEVSIQADIYSLGCTLFKLLFGTAPLDHRQFNGNVLGQLNAIHHALEAGALPNLAEKCAELPPGLAEVLQRMLAVRPEQRYQTPAEVVQAIAPIAAGHDLPALVGRVPVTPLTTVPNPRRPGRRRAITAWSLVSLSVMSLLGAVIYFTTNFGDLSIEVLDEQNTKVVVSRGGKVVDIIDTREKRTVRLRPDNYELAIENLDQRDLVLSTNQVTIRRGAMETARIKLQPKPVVGVVAVPVEPRPAPTRWRNPFGLEMDVPDPDGLDVMLFAKQGFTQLKGEPDDENAQRWTSHVSQDPPDTIAGEWRSRWKCANPKHDGWHEGISQVRIVNDRVFILHQEQHTDYLIEARRDGDRLIGRYINVRGTYKHDSFPWMGILIGNDRIDGLWGTPQDGQWFNRRWDLRRKLEILRFSDDFDEPGRGWLIERTIEREFGFRNGRYFIQTPSTNGYWAWGAMPVYAAVDVELIGRTVEATNGAWGIRVENQASPKDGFYVGVTGNSEVILGVFNETAPEQPVTVRVNGQDASLSIAQPLKISSPPLIRPAGEFNTLRLRVDQRTVHVFVNGEQVCQPFTLPQAVSPVALYLAAMPDGPPGVNAEFDRVRIWTADAAPALPLPPTPTSKHDESNGK